MKKTPAKPTVRKVSNKRTAAPKPADVEVESDTTLKRTRPADRVDEPNTQPEGEALPPQPTNQVEDGSIPRSAPNHPDRHA